MICNSNKSTLGYKLFDCTSEQSKVHNLISDPEIKNALKNVFITLLNEDKDFQESVKTFFEYSIATSELKILKRLAAVEQILGIEDYGDTEAPTIPQKLTEIEDKVIALSEEQKPNLELPESLPTTVTDIRTDFLIKHLQESEDIPKVPSRGIELPFINSREFKAFISNILPEQLRPKSYKNLRKIKKDIFENAVERYSSVVTLDKSKHGNKEIRLIALPGVTG
jgi:hypothetical protein